MNHETIKKHLQKLRKEVIEQDGDPIAARVAQAMETAIRKVTEEGLVGWPSLQDEARAFARLIRKEIQ